MVIILNVFALIFCSCGGQATNKQISKMKNTIDIEKIDIVGHWQTDATVIGLDILGKSNIANEYELLGRVQEEDFRDDYFDGWQVQFKSDGSFESSYTSWCGNDDHHHVIGSYEYTDANHIRIYVDTIIAHFYYGGGKSGTFKLNGKELGVFLIDSIANGFRLIRTIDGETDQELLMYSDMLRNLPSITARNWNSFKWLNLDPHNRTNDNHKILSKGLAAVGSYAPNKAKLLYSRRHDGGIIAFVFRYEKQNLIALYSAGPEVFAVYDPAQPPIELEKYEVEDY